MRVSILERLKRWGFEGSLSLAAAIIFSQGVISPLSLGLAGLFFALQANANFPVYSLISSVKEDIDDDYQPDESDSEDESLDQDFEDELGNTPINDGIRAQLFETSVTTFAKPSGLHSIAGMTWLLRERVVTYEQPKLNTHEIACMEYGSTRSGRSFRQNQQ